MTEFLIPITVNALPSISDLQGKQGMFILSDGSININRKDGTWMVINKQSDHAGILKPSGTVTTQPGVAKWYWAGPGTYSNIAPGIVIDRAGIISYDGEEWDSLNIEIPNAKIKTWVAQSYFVGDQVINSSDSSIYEATAPIISSEVPGISNKWIKKIGGSNFNEKAFNYVLDFSKDNFGKYTELIGAITFSEGPGSVFGKVAYVKLTGGTVTFPSDFVPQLGTTDYDPSKTNVIAFWKEYDKVRYFNETSALEPVPTYDIITSYNFTNRTPNSALSTIPHIGTVLVGNITDHSISTDGQFLRRLTTATSGAAAIAVDTGGVINYKATLVMSIYNMLDLLIGGNTYDNYVNYINIRAQSPASDVVWVSASNPTGTTIATTPNIPYPQVDWYLWEFVVNGSQVKFYCNGNFIVEYTNPNTGNYFSFLLNRKEDGVKSFKIEKL
ncbi:hypothetical protein ACVVIH_06945 [Chryseobacterium arthrosphaerae]